MPMPYNTAFYTSFLFLIPTFFGYILGTHFIAITSFICFITSSINHYYSSENDIAHNIDVVCVRIISLINIGIAYYSYGFRNIFINIMYLFALLTANIYSDILLSKNQQLKEFHYLVHYTSMTGILFYILGKTK